MEARGRIPYFEGLRGVAALVVLFTHLLITLLSQIIIVGGADSPLTRLAVPLGKLPIGFLWNGNSAVCVFFVLSGYVMANFGFGAKIGLTAQIVRRYVRLALPVLIASAAAYVLMRFGLLRNAEAGQAIYSEWLGSWYRFAPSGRAMIYESLVGTFLTGSHDYNPNIWTMQAELVGSICILATVALARGRRERSALYLLFAAISIATYLPLFAVGALLREFREEVGLGLTRPLVPVIAFVMGCYLCSVPATNEPLPWHSFLELFRGEGLRYVHEAGAILLVWGLMFAPGIQSFFNHKFAQFLGRISFTLYLIHVPIICSLTAGLILLCSGMGRIALILVCAPVTLVVCIGGAYLLTPVIDEAPTKLSRIVGAWVQQWMGRRISNQPAPTAGPDHTNGAPYDDGPVTTNVTS